MTDPTPGSPEWIATVPKYGHRGQVHAVIRLLQQERISTAKALELVEAVCRYPHGGSIQAPWDDVNWCEDFDPATIASDFFEVESFEGWEELRRELVETGMIEEEGALIPEGMP